MGVVSFDSIKDLREFKSKIKLQQTLLSMINKRAAKSRINQNVTYFLFIYCKDSSFFPTFRAKYLLF